MCNLTLTISLTTAHLHAEQYHYWLLGDFGQLGI
jgi:hypothetical protein